MLNTHLTLLIGAHVPYSEESRVASRAAEAAYSGERRGRGSLRRRPLPPLHPAELR